MAASFFCEHKKLRTSCPECRPPPPPPPAPHEERVRPRIEPAERAAKEPEGPRPLGRPVRARKKKVTAREADHAVAWWVKKD